MIKIENFIPYHNFLKISNSLDIKRYLIHTVKNFKLYLKVQKQSYQNTRIQKYLFKYWQSLGLCPCPLFNFSKYTIQRCELIHQDQLQSTHECRFKTLLSPEVPYIQFSTQQFCLHVSKHLKIQCWKVISPFLPSPITILSLILPYNLYPNE